MEIEKLIKKPIGRTKIEYYVTVDGDTTTDAIEYCMELMAKDCSVVTKEGDDLEVALREKLGDAPFEYYLKNHVMGRIMPFVIRDEANLDMAFEPSCTSDETPTRGEEFSFTINVLLRPKYKLSSYDPVEVTVPRYDVSEDAVDEKIEQIARNNTTYRKKLDTGEPVALGQYVQIDMRCWQGSKEVEALKSDGRLLKLDYEYMPEDFIDHVVGMKVGETREFDFVNVRNNPKGEDFIDRFHCKVKIDDLMEEVVPVVDDEWVEKNFPDTGTVDNMRSQLRAELEREAEDASREDMNMAVDFALAERFEGDISNELFQAAAQSILENMRRNLQRQGKTLEQYLKEEDISGQEFNTQVALQANSILRQGFALDKLFEVKFGELTDEDIEDAYKAIAPDQEEEAKASFKESGREYAVTEVAKRLVAHRWLLETAKVNYKDAEEYDREQSEAYEKFKEEML